MRSHIYINFGRFGVRKRRCWRNQVDQTKKQTCSFHTAIVGENLNHTVSFSLNIRKSKTAADHLEHSNNCWVEVYHQQPVRVLFIFERICVGRLVTKPFIGRFAQVIAFVCPMQLPRTNCHATLPRPQNIDASSASSRTSSGALVICWQLTRVRCESRAHAFAHYALNMNSTA